MSNVLKFTEKKVEGVFGSALLLENGVELWPSDWNGEVYITGGKSYKPVQVPDIIDDDGEVLQYDIIGFEEV